MLFRIIACALTIPLGVHAQACPDVEVQTVPLRVSVHGMMDCENPAARFLPTPNGPAMRGCPAIVVVEPPHDTPRAREGCGTYVRVRERVPVLVYAFSCEVSYFLFIPIATNCVMVDKRVIGHRLSYEPVPCEPRGGSVSMESGGD